MLPSETLETIKSTIPLLEEHGRTITDHFYSQLFSSNPELKNIFNMANQAKGGQSHALSDAIVAYAKNIENVEVLLPVVQRIAHKHASLGIQAEHYPIVGENLLLAIQKVLNIPADHPAIVAWGEAYGILANVFIDTEAAIYQENKDQDNGWAGYQDFKIDNIVEETPEVKSFYFKKTSDQQVPSYKGGQYLGVRVKPNTSEYFQTRQYSISQFKASPEHFRISVKAEHSGLVSNFLHSANVGDTISLQAPTGVFTLVNNKPKHIFVAGGVGITPLMSMMQEALNAGVEGKDILFIQCAKDQQHQIFKRDFETLIQENGIQHKLCFDNSDLGDHQGLLNQAVLESWTKELNFDPTSAQVYFCGPLPFMSLLNTLFTHMNYQDSDIHYEVFGPTTSL